LLFRLWTFGRKSIESVSLAAQLVVARRGAGALRGRSFSTGEEPEFALTAFDVISHVADRVFEQISVFTGHTWMSGETRV
jgi:hypothetical protein